MVISDTRSEKSILKSIIILIILTRMFLNVSIKNYET
jgi:hypothetical protein